MRRLVLLVLLLGILPLAIAKEAAPLAEDPVVEKRLVAIADELRCLVCQNESLSGSRAELAMDLRREIREQIKAGRSDADIMEYMVARYGDFVRYRPPLKGTTLLLWFGPFLLLVAGIVTLVLYLRGRKRLAAQAPLSEAERARVAALLANAQEASAEPGPSPGGAPPKAQVPEGKERRG